jgi:hypothetical protein
MKSNRIQAWLCLSLFISCVPVVHEAYGQSTSSSAKSTKRSGTRVANPREVTITETFEPSFSIEPLSHRIEGRSGDVVPFKFKLETSNRKANVEVSVIGLRQELSGQILHDEESTNAATYVKLVSPTTMTLEPGVPTLIEGVVQLPRGNAKFYSLGILVKDIGIDNPLASKTNPDGSPSTQAAVRFMTQYVLRLDLELQGTRGEEGRQIVLEEVSMVPQDGRPKLQTVVFNPTETAFEFQLRGRLRSSPSDRSFKPLRLVMPVRRGTEDENRYVGRILPKSRIRMEELLPEAIAGGHYDVDLELVFDGQVVNRKTLPLDVNSRDYPAQEVLIAQVEDGLQVSPAQIELSRARGGVRRLTMLINNHSREAKTIDLKALAENQLEIGAAMIQPSTFSLSPSSSRKISISLRAIPGEERKVQYGKVVITSKSSERDYEVTHSLPLALVMDNVDEPEVKLARLQWDPSQPYPGFRIAIENTGDVHFPMQARLLIVDEYGRRVSVPGGFGRWLMPRSSGMLDFRFDQPLSPGQYQLRCEVQRQGEPLVVDQVFTVTDMENATSVAN